MSRFVNNEGKEFVTNPHYENDYDVVILHMMQVGFSVNEILNMFNISEKTLYEILR